MSRSRVFVAAFLLAGASLFAADPPRKDLSEALIATIRKVGKEGTGNQQAATAWKALVACGPSALESILSAMKDDDRVANNWLVPAFEAIAEKSLEQNSLPTATLEKTIANIKRSNVSRSLAYTWLVKHDDSATTRLLPGMLTDPAPQLRRLAVDHAIKMADTLADKGMDNKQALATATPRYQKAFAAAGDPEQVDNLAKTLTKLGEKPDVAAQLGVIQNWHLITPFDHTKGSGFNKAYPPEKGVDLTATYKGKNEKEATWVEYRTKNPEGVVDLKAVLGPLKGTIAYAFATIDMAKAQSVELRAGCINGLKIFVNGKEVFAREEYHHGSRIDQYSVRVDLKQGKNEILLKVCQNEQKENWAQRWYYQLRVCDTVGCGVPFTQTGPRKESR